MNSPGTDQRPSPPVTARGGSVPAPGDGVIPAQPLLMRILVRRYVYRHPRAWGSLCLAAGSWLVILGTILCAYGFWWGAGLIAVGALELWIAYHLLVAPLPQRVRELEQSRARAVDDSAARLRRIERDLHDGAQAQMVAVAMKLGLAREKLGRNDRRDRAGRPGRGSWSLSTPPTAAPRRPSPNCATWPAASTRRSSTRASGTALTTLAAHSDVPVELAIDLPERPSAAIETIAYFCAAELLTNVAKHSGARHATLNVVSAPGLLRLRVGDDGSGGACVEDRGGLAGLAERVRTVDGTLQVSSPPGGPTVVAVELPSHA